MVSRDTISLNFCWFTKLAYWGGTPYDVCIKRRSMMKVTRSLKTLKSRHKACVVVRRKGRLYVVNKQNPRFKARQG